MPIESSLIAEGSNRDAFYPTWQQSRMAYYELPDADEQAKSTSRSRRDRVNGFMLGSMSMLMVAGFGLAVETAHLFEQGCISLEVLVGTETLDAAGIFFAAGTARNYYERFKLPETDAAS